MKEFLSNAPIFSTKYEAKSSAQTEGIEIQGADGRRERETEAVTLEQGIVGQQRAGPAGHLGQHKVKQSATLCVVLRPNLVALPGFAGFCQMSP